MDPHNRAAKNTNHGNEVLPQDNTHLIQRPCYQRGSPCQDPAGNWTTQRSHDHHIEMQTAAVWSYLPCIRSGQTILQGSVKGGRIVIYLVCAFSPVSHKGLCIRTEGKKTWLTEEEVGKQHQGMDRRGVCQVPEGSGELEKKRKMKETGCEITRGAPTTLAVKG